MLFAAVPLSGVWADLVAYHCGRGKATPVYESGIALIPALLGAYTGAVLRWGVRRARV